MIPREGHRRALERLLSRAPVVALLGARQVGKTTLAREVARRRKGSTHFFDLESSADAARLADPLLTLSPLRGLVVIDEVQRRPGLFPSLRVLADRPRRPARFLVLGSASPDLLRQSAETLAGRVAHYELPGFTLPEVTPLDTDRLWLRGGFPPSYTARSHADSYRWRGDFINLIQALGVDARQCYFWATHSGTEVDLVVQRRSRLRGFEIKRTSAPTLTRSMRAAAEDLGLSRLDVIHAGEHSFPLARHVHAVAGTRILDDL